MKVVQCSLRYQENKSVGHTVCWLEQRPDLREGVYVTLKDSEEPGRRWWVEHVGTVVKEKKDIHRPGAFFESDL